MLQNLPLKTLVHKNLTIEGYSRAAVQSYWRIPELKVGFDLGAQPWDFMTTPTWLVTHAHMDHILCLPAYVARRRMMKMEPPRIFLPTSAVDSVQKILRLYTRLDGGRLPCELVGVAPGDEIEISRELVAVAFPTVHGVPSVGFCVFERKHKLKAQYLSLSGTEIRDLKLSGVEITEEVRVPRAAYTGDTSPGGLDGYPPLYQAQVLITEVTFVAPGHRKEKIHKFGHCHLNDILERRDRFKNELIIAGHFSTRYHDEQIRRQFQKDVPDMFGGRLHLWL